MISRNLARRDRCGDDNQDMNRIDGVYIASGSRESRNTMVSKTASFSQAQSKMAKRSVVI